MWHDIGANNLKTPIMPLLGKEIHSLEYIILMHFLFDRLAFSYGCLYCNLQAFLNCNYYVYLHKQKQP